MFDFMANAFWCLIGIVCCSISLVVVLSTIAYAVKYFKGESGNDRNDRSEQPKR